MSSASTLQECAGGWLRRGGLVALVVCCVGWTSLRAQQVLEVTPMPANVAASATVAADPSAFGSLSGTITDEDGDFVKSAQVTLHGSVGGQAQAISDSAGRFMFPRLAAQSFTLTVSASGFAQATASGTVAAGQGLELPPIVLRAASDQEVEAISQQAQAEIEIRQEETQRVFGVAPNFYVVYDWHAQPLTKRQKFELTWKTTIDPVSWLINGGFAGIEQAENALPGYGPGAVGYARRFGAASGDFLVGTYTGGAIFPILFRQDPRYFYMGPGHSVMKRALYALSTSVIARGDNGRWQPAYAGVLGDLASGAASNLYYPRGSRNGLSTTIESGMVSVGLDGVGNLVQEFLFRKVTPGSHKGSDAGR